MAEHGTSSSTRRTTRLLYALARDCSECRSREGLLRIAQTHVRDLLPHSSLLAILGRLDLEHLEIVHMVPVDFPAAGLAALKPLINLRQRPALMHWLRTREPMVLDLADDAQLMSPLERDEIHALCLGRVAAHGVVDMAARSGSYFSFAGVPSSRTKADVGATVNLIVPHLHQALMSVYTAERESIKQAPLLSQAEQDLIHLVAAGRTNAEIASARGTSAATVRNQLTSAFKKLGARNRAEAVRQEFALTHSWVARSSTSGPHL